MLAFLAAPLIRYGLIALAFVLLAGYAVMERNNRIAAEKGEKAARLESDLHTADAERYRAAVADRDTRITDLASQLNSQSAEVEAHRAKESDLRKALDSARLENERMQQDQDQLQKDLAAEVEKAPGDVRELGPIVLRRVGGLWE